MAAPNKTPPIVLPKIAGKARVSAPSYPTNSDTIIDNETRYLNQSIKTLRSIDPIRAIKALTRYSGVFSTAVHIYVQLAMSGYKVTAYKVGTHEYDPVGTAVGTSILTSLDTLYDYTIGFGDKQSIDGILETLLKEVVQTGACAAELVLDKFLLVDYLAPIQITSIYKWEPGKNGTKYPVQRSQGGGDDVKLNKPTIFYSSMQQATDSIYPRSPLEAALQTAFEFGEFVEDVYRILKRSGHSRLIATLDQAKVMQNIPATDRDDPVKVSAFLDNVRTGLQTILTSLEPDDALVHYDSAKIDVLGAKGKESDYSGLLETFAGLLATGLKTMPSVLGLRIGGSQSLSNTESLIFLKEVAAIQQPVATVMSRMLTLAMRLASGSDSYVKFEFKPIDIRPESELSAHRSVDRQGVLQLLSIGYYTDDEAAHLLGTGPRAPGAPTLSGTMFMHPKATEPNDMNQNTGPQERTLSEGNSKGSATSKGGGGKGN